jgi:hypothetical protein
MEVAVIAVFREEPRRCSLRDDASFVHTLSIGGSAEKSTLRALRSPSKAATVCAEVGMVRCVLEGARYSRDIPDSKALRFAIGSDCVCSLGKHSGASHER